MYLVEHKAQLTMPWQVANKAEKTSYIGVITFIDQYDLPKSHLKSQLVISYFYISFEDGHKLLNSKIVVAAKNCLKQGASKEVLVICFASWPCGKGGVCEFNDVPTGQGDLFMERYCIRCQKDESGNWTC